jgi:aminoglycoside phosphotransferase (APT) family kinase protein
MRRLLRLPSLHSRAAFSSSVEAPASSVRHEISEENLRVHLEKHGILDANQTFTTTQFTHGQSNPTYSLYVDGEPRFVVRRQPPGELLPGAHRVDREFRVMSALGGPGSTAPVPRTRIYSEDASLVGTPFFVYDFVEGWFHPNPALPNATSPEERRALYNGMADAIARVHAADVGVMGLEDFGKHEGYVGRQIKTWSRAYAASATQQMSAMDTLREKLPSLDPTQNRAGGKVFVAHGDLRLDNMIFLDGPATPSPSPSSSPFASSIMQPVAAVLDWELSTLADTPQLDLAYACMAFHLPPFEGCSYTGLKGLEGTPATEGLPTEQEFIDSYVSSFDSHYQAAAGNGQIKHFDMSHHKYFLALAFFKAAAIGQGVYQRGIAGNASSPQAKIYGDSAKMCAEMGLGFLRDFEDEAGIAA